MNYLHDFLSYRVSKGLKPFIENGICYWNNYINNEGDTILFSDGVEARAWYSEHLMCSIPKVHSKKDFLDLYDELEFRCEIIVRNVKEQIR